MGQKRLRFGFDVLGNRVYAFRGGASVEEQLVVPANKEEITEEFERAIAMYVGCGGNGSRLIQYEEAGELLTFEVMLKQVETTRRLREKKQARFRLHSNNVEGSISPTLLFSLIGFFIAIYFLSVIL